VVKLIVGLGNPGAKYDGTRHNVGFDVVDILAKRWGLSMTTEKFHAWFTQGECGGEKVVLLKPTTFMNRSGQAVLAAGRFYKLDARDLLVITDDHALPLGKLRIRMKGSAGGHNGLGHIIESLGSDGWCRLRIGIGEPFGVPSVYVLSRFSPDEETVVGPARVRAADAAEAWITEGPEAAMNRFNREA
jgi:PTH1 family peptidyl-tRNA hydrolase